jgi:acetyl-CoA carboxylase carboxyltransferase component
MAAMPASSGGPTAKLDAAQQAAAEAEQASGPYKMADRLVYDDIIDPRELRDRIIGGLSMLELP